MTVEELIKELSKFPQDARVMCPDMGVGWSVNVVGVEKADDEWVEIVLGE